jgi:DNA polymerase-3 subunit chi
MQVDFYQLAGEPAPAMAAQLAAKVLGTGERLLIVAAPDALDPLAEALWGAGEPFLANGKAGGAHDARQPILLAEEVAPANGARFLLLADGQWRDPGDRFDRAMLLFDAETIAGARAAWRQLGEGVTRRYWKRQDGRWVEGP